MKNARVISTVVLAALAWANGSFAQSPVDVTVPAGAGTTDIIDFLTPSAADPDLIVVARFLIDDDAPTSGEDLTFTFQAHDAKYVAFELRDIVLGSADNFVTVIDATLPAGPSQQAAFIEVTLPGTTTATGFRVIEISVSFLPGHTFAAPDQGRTWSVQARGRASPFDPGELEFPIEFVGFVEKGSDAAALRTLVDRPKLEISPATLPFGEAQINMEARRTPLLPFTWANVGPGLFTPSGLLDDGIPSPFDLVGSPAFVALKPGETSVVTSIEFAPTALGLVGETLEISANINGTPEVAGSAAMSGTGIDLTVIMLLDVSGSMDQHYQTDAWYAPEPDQRLWLAKQAGKQLFTAYQDLTSEKSRFGLYTFPDSATPTEASSKRRVPLALTAGQLPEADSLLAGEVGVALGAQINGGLVANGDTPMLAGLNLAVGDLPSGVGTYQRPILLLLSDGAHHLPPPPELPLTAVPLFEAKDAKIYSVAFGEMENTEVDHELLIDLSTQTDGVYLSALTSDTVSIKEAFRTALSDWLSLSDVADPPGTITAGESKSHEVCLDDKAYQALFVLDWRDQRDDAIDFRLETPLGVTLTGSSPGVSFSKDKSYAMYVVSGEHIRAGKGAGLWKLKLTGNASVPGSLDYEYSVKTQKVTASKPRWVLPPGFLDAGLRNIPFYAGEPWVVEFPIEPDLKDRIDASEMGIRAVLDAPQSSLGTFLASSKVERDWIFPQTGSGLVELSAFRNPAEFLSAESVIRPPGAKEIVRESPSIGTLKARALAKFADQKFANERRQSEFRLRDDGTGGDRIAGDNVYSIALPKSRYDGVYGLRLLLDLAPTRRGCSNLNTTLWTYVPVNLGNAVALAENVKWASVDRELFFDAGAYAALKLDSEPEKGIVREAVVVMLRDDQGNYYGPGKADKISFKAKTGRLVGPVVDNWDGSYIQVVEYKKGTDPAFTVSAGGFTSEPFSPKPTWPPRWLWWVLLVVVVLLGALVIKLYRRTP